MLESKHTTLKEDIFQHMAMFKVYLPIEELEKVTERIKKNKSYFQALYEIEADESLKVFTDINKGAYAVKLELDRTNKKVQKVDPVTNKVVKTYPSLYAAGKEHKGGHGNICTSVRKGTKAYGHYWRTI